MSHITFIQIHSFRHLQFCITYPIANGTLINVVASVTDPRLAGTYYEGHWVSDGSRDELVESFDDFEPDTRTLVKVDSLHIDQILPV